MINVDISYPWIIGHSSGKALYGPGGYYEGEWEDETIRAALTLLVSSKWLPFSYAEYIWGAEQIALSRN